MANCLIRALLSVVLHKKICIPILFSPVSGGRKKREAGL